jgi:hypothetical protein
MSFPDAGNSGADSALTGTAARTDKAASANELRMDFDGFMMSLLG